MKKYDMVEELFGDIPLESKIFINKLNSITERIECILLEKGWSQKEFAHHLSKNESEVSKWLTTPHNLTLKTIAKIEAILGEELISIPGHTEANEKIKFIYLTVKAEPFQSVVEFDKEPLPMYKSGISSDFSRETERSAVSLNRSLAS